MADNRDDFEIAKEMNRLRAKGWTEIKIGEEYGVSQGEAHLIMSLATLSRREKRAVRSAIEKGHFSWKAARLLSKRDANVKQEVIRRLESGKEVAVRSVDSSLIRERVTRKGLPKGWTAIIHRDHVTVTLRIPAGIDEAWRLSYFRNRVFKEWPTLVQGVKDEWTELSH